MDADKRKRRKILVLVIIAFFITITSIVVYGINLHLKSNVAIQLDYSEFELKVDLTNKSNGVLVPVGRVTNNNEVDMYMFTYYVILREEQISLFSELTVKVKEIVISGTNLEHLVNVDIDGFGEIHTYNLSEDKIEVSVKVTLNEPKDELEYLEIINKKINITLIFEVK